MKRFYLSIVGSAGAPNFAFEVDAIELLGAQQIGDAVGDGQSVIRLRATGADGRQGCEPTHAPMHSSRALPATPWADIALGVRHTVVILLALSAIALADWLADKQARSYWEFLGNQSERLLPIAQWTCAWIAGSKILGGKLCWREHLKTVAMGVTAYALCKLLLPFAFAGLHWVLPSWVAQMGSMAIMVLAATLHGLNLPVGNRAAKSLAVGLFTIGTAIFLKPASDAYKVSAKQVNFSRSLPVGSFTESPMPREQFIKELTGTLGLLKVPIYGAKDPVRVD